MIPKIIHYAWVGPSMPNNIKSRVKEWERKLPDWEFKFWNESNYNFNKFKFTKRKLEHHEYGYVADELRFDVLEKFGGFYLDTDMIIKKNLQPLLNKNLVMGFMYDNSLLTSLIGSEPNNPILQEILNVYANPKYDSIKMSMTSNPFITNFFLSRFSHFKLNGETQIIAPNSVIYSRDYFCYPSENNHANYAEHLFDNAWNNGNAYKGVKGKMKKIFHSVAPITYGKIANQRGIIYSRSLINSKLFK